jgi:hypothetical protein
MVALWVQWSGQLRGAKWRTSCTGVRVSVCIKTSRRIKANLILGLVDEMGKVWIRCELEVQVAHGRYKLALPEADGGVSEKQIHKFNYNFH